MKKMIDKLIEKFVASFLSWGRRQIKRRSEASDTCYCQNCGNRRKSLGEVSPIARNGVCLYFCTRCDQVTTELG